MNRNTRRRCRLDSRSMSESAAPAAAAPGAHPSRCNDRGDPGSRRSETDVLRPRPRALETIPPDPAGPEGRDLQGCVRRPVTALVTRTVLQIIHDKPLPGTMTV